MRNIGHTSSLNGDVHSPDFAQKETGRGRERGGMVKVVWSWGAEGGSSRSGTTTAAAAAAAIRSCKFAVHSSQGDNVDLSVLGYGFTVRTQTEEINHRGNK